MKVALLGTGAADGIPQPFCHCETCDDARSTGNVRLAGGVLVDGVLLIDPAPCLAGSAARARADLTAVTTVLVSHAHHDHWDPAFLLHRQWSDCVDRPLTILGPPTVIAQAQQWLPSGTAVQLRVVSPGDLVECPSTGHTVRVLPSNHGAGGSDALAEEAVLYDVAAPESRQAESGRPARLLYASDTGVPDAAMLTAIADARYDLVLLELTFGDPGLITTPGHLDHSTFQTTIDLLRRAAAVTADTDVIAIHLGHHNPPEASLHTWLARVGARAVPDGTVLEVPPSTRADRGPTAHSTLVLGGARSGKSTFAENLVAAAGDVHYVATGWPLGSGMGADWEERIRRHTRRRPPGWRTLETIDLGETLRRVPTDATVLIDCLALWCSRIIDEASGWDDERSAASAIQAATSDLCEAIRTSPARKIVLVSNEVGSGVVPAHASGRLFRDVLGAVNTDVAEACDDAVLMVAGRALSLTKGRR